MRCPFVLFIRPYSLCNLLLLLDNKLGKAVLMNRGHLLLLVLLNFTFLLQNLTQSLNIPIFSLDLGTLTVSIQTNTIYLGAIDLISRRPHRSSWRGGLFINSFDLICWRCDIHWFYDPVYLLIYSGYTLPNARLQSLRLLLVLWVPWNSCRVVSQTWYDSMAMIFSASSISDSIRPHISKAVLGCGLLSWCLRSSLYFRAFMS